MTLLPPSRACDDRLIDPKLRLYKHRVGQQQATQNFATFLFFGLKTATWPAHACLTTAALTRDITGQNGVVEVPFGKHHVGVQIAGGKPRSVSYD